jgi:hypothetical protein
VNDILQWLPMPEKTPIDRTKLPTVRLALRCLAEMLSPETHQEDTKEGKLALSKRAYDHYHLYQIYRFVVDICCHL